MVACQYYHITTLSFVQLTVLKKIPVSKLRIGMYIHDLGCPWMRHPFVRSSFLLTSQTDLQQILALGIADLTIDSSKGHDAADVMAADPLPAADNAKLVAIATAMPASPRVPLAEEIRNAAALRRQAVRVVQTVMRDVRLGRAVRVGEVADVVEGITASILRNSGALLSLSLIKTKDDYTFLHSVSVCALLVAFCRARNLDADTLYQAGIGGLLHDTGKALVPDDILNKPGRLTPEEFDIVRRHPRDGYELLRRCPEIGPIPLDIALHHHERPDGTGYPERKGEPQISELAQMAAIVDVYDAITSDRCYHKGLPPSEALRRMLGSSNAQFDPSLMQEFVRCLGIYPVGTLVRLESGRLAVVAEAHPTDLLNPSVVAFFSTKSATYIRPETIDLARGLGFGGGDKIVSAESPQKWQVDPMRFLVAA